MSDLFSNQQIREQANHIAGVDEVGRGPLVGNVVAAAVILPVDHGIEGLRDSKKLSEKKRESLFQEIIEKSTAYAIAYATPQEIDDINILQASLLAMKRSVENLNVQPDFVLVDGNKLPAWHYPSEAVVGGDDQEACIAAASILAKVARDKEMKVLDAEFPQYGFAQHKGYPTKAHMQALQENGPCVHHRKSFKPVRRAIEEHGVMQVSGEEVKQ